MQEGELIQDIFVVKIKKGINPYKKGFRFNLILSDSSGSSLDYTYWGSDNEEEVKQIYQKIKADSVIYAQGRVGSYNGTLQLSSDFTLFPKVLSAEEYEADFIKTSDKNLDVLFAELSQKIESINDGKIKNLLNQIFSEIGHKFKNHPGAISIHHNWKGGLLEHTLEVVEYCEKSLVLFPSLDRDLLIAGAILHDIGKLEELETTSRIKGSEIGQLAGHLVLGVSFLIGKLKESDLESLKKNKLIHLLVSHHGKIEYGSPKEAMFPEAVALYYADELSSKLSEMTNFVEESKDSTEDDFMYHRRSSKNIFLK